MPRRLNVEVRYCKFACKHALAIVAATKSSRRPAKEKAARKGDLSNSTIEASLFGSSFSENRGFRGSAFFTGGLTFSTATRTARAAAGIATAGLALALRCSRAFVFHRDFGGNTVDFRLRATSVNRFRLLHRRRYRSGRLLFALMLLMRRLNDDDVVIVTRIHFVAVTVRVVTIIVILAVVTLEAFLHLRLSGGNDAVIVFGVLQVILSYDAVAGALGVTGELRIFFSYVLGSAADFHIWAGAIVGPGQRVPTLTVEIIIVVISTAAIVIVVVIATPSTALVLLSWPHRSFT
jgi:hypothetical protein